LAWEGDLSPPKLPDMALRPILNPMQWVMDALFLELKWPGCGTHDSHNLVLRLRIIGVTNPLQQMHSWHSSSMQAALLRVLILLVYSSKQQE
jgi:hypothetical protein